jgi:hypothetical protein
MKIIFLKQKINKKPDVTPVFWLRLPFSNSLSRQAANLTS